MENMEQNCFMFFIDLKYTLSVKLHSKSNMEVHNMSYTISEVAKMMGVAPSTLRYYDKEGLLSNVNRVNGIRVFEEKDFKWLRVLNCLKNTGMPIRKIKQYVDLAQEGDSTLVQRHKLIQEQRRYVQDQIDQLQYFIQELDYKDWYYQQAIQAGSESVVMNDDHGNFMKLDQIPNKGRK